MKWLILLLIFGGTLLYVWYHVTLKDRFFWPQSGYTYLERIAESPKDGHALSSVCHAGRHQSNLIANSGFYAKHKDGLIKTCLMKIQPVQEAHEVQVGKMVRRVYRASEGDFICELNATAVRYDERVTGRDCGLAMFLKSNDPGIGISSNVDGG